MVLQGSVGVILGVMVSTTKESRRDCILQQGRKGAKSSGFWNRVQSPGQQILHQVLQGGICHGDRRWRLGTQCNLFLDFIFQQKDADKHPLSLHIFLTRKSAPGTIGQQAQGTACDSKGSAAAPSTSVHFITFHCLQQQDSERKVPLRLKLATENYLVISDKQQKYLDSVPKDAASFLQSIAKDTG